jgi:hypothetical protein
MPTFGARVTLSQRALSATKFHDWSTFRETPHGIIATRRKSRATAFFKNASIQTTSECNE